MNRKNRKHVIWITAVIVVGLLLLWNYWPMKNPWVVSIETTGITAPLLSDGTVDYYRYVDERASEGVTPEANAAIGWIQLVGPERVYGSEDLDRSVRLAAEKLGVPAESLYTDLEWISMDTYCESSEGAEWERFDDDAFFGWEEVFDRVREFPWEPEDFPTVAAYFDANAEALDHMVATMQRPDYYLPMIPVTDPPILGFMAIRGGQSSFLGQKEVIDALSSRAMMRLGSGDLQGAWEDILTIRRLARVQGDTLMGLSLAIAHEERGLLAQDYLLRDDGLTLELLQQVAEDSATLDPISLQDAWGGERLLILAGMQVGFVNPEDGWLEMDFQKDLVEDVAPGAKVDAAAYMRRVNGYLTRMYDAAGGSNCREISASWDAIASEAEAGAFQWMFDDDDDSEEPEYRWVAKSGRVGRMWLTRKMADSMMGIMLPPTARMTAVPRWGWITAQDTIQRTQMALQRYRGDHGEYPSELSQLVPTYLPEVPRDPFSGSAIVFLRGTTGCVFYSVGPNGIDEGGYGPSSFPDPEDGEVDDIGMVVFPHREEPRMDGKE